MAHILALWLPILLSAFLVFLVSFVLHSVLKYHETSLKPLPDEDGIMAALRDKGLEVGEYVMPHAKTNAERVSEEFKAKAAAGPTAILTVLDWSPNMGKQLVQWFVYCIVVSIFAALVVGGALQSGAPYMHVFHFVLLTSFAGYFLAFAQTSIWFGRPWSTTLKFCFDGLVYALLTAGTFGWLWPA